MLRFAFVSLLGVSLGGCGLLDPDVFEMDLSMPEKTFTIDSSQWSFPDQASFPAIPCADMQGVCSAGIAQACGNDALCFGSCDGTNCKALALVSLFQAVNLFDEKPELQTINDQPLVSVTVNNVTYSVTENTMNQQTPEMTLYVAPSTVMSPGDPQALAVGTFPPIGAEVLLDTTQMVFVEGGRAALREFMKDYKTEFNVIVGGEIDMSAGDPIPTGRLKAVITVDATAGL